MPTLLDHIDRFSLAASSLTRTAEDSESSLTNGDPGPFARAVLHASGMDVIRDALDSELGLFTLVPSMSAISSSQGQPHAVAGAQARVGKVEFGEATPLRKGRVAARLQRDLDADAEIYAEAALKFLDRYQAIKPMPRIYAQLRTLVKQITDTRENIENMQESLQQLNDTAPLSPKSRANDEERRVNELQARLALLRKRREALQQQSHSASQEDAEEDRFWTSGGPSATNDGLLLDEEVDEGVHDISSDFASPPARLAMRSMRVPIEPLAIDQGADDNVLAAEADEDGATVVMRKVPSVSPPSTPQPQEESLATPTRPFIDPSPSQPTTTPLTIREVETPVTVKKVKPRLKISSETERIVAKMWRTVGEEFSPGHPYDVSGEGGDNKPKPPKAKETIVILETLATSSSQSAPSPSSHSTLSSTIPSTTHGPTTYQIQAARLLLTLLQAGDGGANLKDVKDILKNADSGAAVKQPQAPTRALYKCVAKKMVKIDRGGGEQIVKFDI